MSPIYYGGTDCPKCGATIPQGEPCQICTLRAQLTERDREIRRLRDSCGELLPHDTFDWEEWPGGWVEILSAWETAKKRLAERDRKIERLKARCWNDDMTLDMNSKASAILGKMIGESLDEAAQRVIDEFSASQAREREAVECAEKAKKVAQWFCDETENYARRLGLEAHESNSGNGPYWLGRLFGYGQDTSAALAAARKALKRIEKEAYELGPEYWGLSDIARAALNGDSPDGADNNRNQALGRNP